MLDEISTERKFSEFLDSLGDKKASFYENPVEMLLKAEIPIVPAILPPDRETMKSVDPTELKSMLNQAKDAPATAQAAAETERLTVETKWWGVDIIMNERLTQDILTGSVPVGSLGGLIAGGFVAAGVIAGPIAAVLGTAFAAGIAIKVAEIKIADNGKGVHWPVTWPQWAVLVAAVGTMGPTGLAAAAAAVLHPLRN